MSTNSPNDSKSTRAENPAFFDKADNRNTVVYAPTRTGMSDLYAELRLTDAECAKIIAKSSE